MLAVAPFLSNPSTAISLEKHRNDVIDAFRGVAIFSVILFHFLVRWAPPTHETSLYGYEQLFSTSLKTLRNGVLLFFIISGLVITMTLVRSDNVRAFVIKRFARLYPALIFCATLTFFLMRWAGPDLFQTSWSSYLSTFFLASHALHFPWVDGVYWTLEVEIKFYLLAACSYLLLKERFWIGIIAFGVAGLVVSYISYPAGSYYFIVRYIPYFLAGMGFYFFLFNKDRRAATWCGGAALVLFLCYLPHLKIGAVLYVFITGAMLFSLLYWKPGMPLGPLAYLGRISYSLYLIHQNIGVTIIGILKREAHWPDMAAFSGAVIACILIAAGIYHSIEKPAQRFILARWQPMKKT